MLQDDDGGAVGAVDTAVWIYDEGAARCLCFGGVAVVVLLAVLVLRFW